MLNIKNEVPELAKFADRYDSYNGQYYIPDNMISESEVKAICEAHVDKDFIYVYEDVFFNADGLPEVGVGSFCIGPRKYVEI